LYAIAGAVEHMLRAGREVCFFVATRPEPVGALSLEQRALERSALIRAMIESLSMRSMRLDSAAALVVWAR
jgi:hypothetical protein